MLPVGFLTASLKCILIPLALANCKRVCNVVSNPFKVAEYAISFSGTRCKEMIKSLAWYTASFCNSCCKLVKLTLKSVTELLTSRKLGKRSIAGEASTYILRFC